MAYQAEATGNPVRLYLGWGFRISGDCLNEAFFSALACLFPFTALATEEDAIIEKASRMALLRSPRQYNPERLVSSMRQGSLGIQHSRGQCNRRSARSH